MTDHRRSTFVDASLLTIERAISDGIDPNQLYMVADANMAKRPVSTRLQHQANNLRVIADRMVLLGYGREGERRLAA